MFVDHILDVASCYHSGAFSWRRLLYLWKICEQLLIPTCMNIFRLSKVDGVPF
jgi:hypothetical protein